MIKVFFIEPTGFSEYFRTFWCDACNKGTRVPMGRFESTYELQWPDEKPDPIECESCNTKTRFSSQGSIRVFKRPDTGEELIHINKYPGACFDDGDIFDRESRTYRTGPDGRSLMVVCPDRHIWGIDGRASNCTMKSDNEHRCWVRHGDPSQGNLHVDKNGITCSAGAGSIDTGKFHGFLHNGYLKSC